jgi:hypothetical protein
MSDFHLRRLVLLLRSWRLIILCSRGRVLLLSRGIVVGCLLNLRLLLVLRLLILRCWRFVHGLPLLLLDHRLSIRRLNRIWRRHCSMDQLSSSLLSLVRAIRIVSWILRDVNTSSLLACKHIIPAVRSNINVFASHQCSNSRILIKLCKSLSFS